jgi:hypothetical protein
MSGSPQSLHNPAAHFGGGPFRPPHAASPRPHAVADLAGLHRAGGARIGRADGLEPAQRLRRLPRCARRAATRALRRHRRGRGLASGRRRGAAAGAARDACADGRTQPAACWSAGTPTGAGPGGLPRARASARPGRPAVSRPTRAGRRPGRRHQRRTPVRVNGEVVALARMRPKPLVRDGGEARFLHDQYRVIAASSAGSDGAGAAHGGTGLARRWTRPLAAVQDATQRLARGEFTVRLAATPELAGRERRDRRRGAQRQSEWPKDCNGWKAPGGAGWPTSRTNCARR